MGNILDKLLPSHDQYMNGLDNEQQKLNVEEARSNGFIIYEAKPNEFILDLDSEEAFQLFRTNVTALSKDLDKEITYNIYPSKSGLPHRHVIGVIEGYRYISQDLKLAIQLLLGSDPIKEMLSIVRCLECHDNISLLFMKGASTEQAIPNNPSIINEIPF